MQGSAYIYAIVSYIEQHLQDNLDPENIARQHFISVSQLYRDFYSCTGHSIKEYIRKRRISNACEKLKCSNLSLSIIAQESGCQTQQAFHKQFKSMVGMTPMEYREKDSYFYFDPFSGRPIGLAVRVKTETIPSCTVNPFYSSCPDGIEDKALAAQGELAGRVFGRNGRQSGGRFCYEMMTERPGDGRTGMFATAVVRYRQPEIRAGWDYLYNTWLPASMFEASEDYFEEYLLQNGRPRRLKLYLPVKKKKCAEHIAVATLPAKAFLIARETGPQAEQRASGRVMDFLQEHHPFLIQSARRFYVSAQGDACECGVECDDGYRLPAGCSVGLLRIPAGRYAVLPEQCLGDMRAGGAKLEKWLQHSGVAQPDGPVFAEYELPAGSFDCSGIRMKLYQRLLDDNNG